MASSMLFLKNENRIAREALFVHNKQEGFLHIERIIRGWKTK